jgi:predicted PurR-regulated permease PerM
MTTNWSKSTRTIVAVSLAIFTLYLVYISRSVIPYLIIAALISVILRPIILWLHSKFRLPLGLSIGLTYLAGVLLVPLGLLLAIPAIVDAVEFVVNLDYQTIFVNMLEWLRSNLNAIKAMTLPVYGLDQFIDRTADTLLYELSQTAITQVPQQQSSIETIVQSLGTALTTTVRTAAGVVSLLFSQITQGLFIFLSSVYFSLSAHTFEDTFLGTLPERFRPEIRILIDRIVRMWNAFFRGELTLMLVIGLFSWLGLTILGVPGALYLGIVAGLLELIPNLGPIIATVPAVIVALLQGSTYLPVSPLVMGLLVLLFYILVQQLENSIIVPRILGEAVDLPALVVMTGVLVGAEVGGLLGALLATPVIATIREVMRYSYRKILEVEPFPAKERLPEPPTNPYLGLWAWLQNIIQRARALVSNNRPPSHRKDR